MNDIGESKCLVFTTHNFNKTCLVLSVLTAITSTRSCMGVSMMLTASCSTGRPLPALAGRRGPKPDDTAVCFRRRLEWASAVVRGMPDLIRCYGSVWCGSLAILA